MTTDFIMKSHKDNKIENANGQELFPATEFGFVVLHYLAYQLTCQCIDNLLRISNNRRAHIVVVDNASPNGSGNLLLGRYGKSSKIAIIKNPVNEGFARGNNVGYNYLIEHFNCDFIIVINNDVMINDVSFLDKVQSIYSHSHFDVLGPDIINPITGSHQNPLYRYKQEYLYGIPKNEVVAIRKYKISRLHHFAWKSLKMSIKQRFFPFLIKNNHQLSTPAIIENQMENVVLHGACFIFSSNYIQKRKYCFNPLTFLYAEEDILHYECMHDDLKIVFDSSIQIEHLEGFATTVALPQKIKRERMRLKESIRSLGILLSIMNDNT